MTPEHRCASEACGAVYSAKSWGDCGACPGCGGTAYTHVDPPATAPEQVAKTDELTGNEDRQVVTAAIEWQGRAVRAEARCAELEGRLEAIRRATR